MGEGNQLLGRVYKILSEQTENVYVGSTTMTLKKRFKIQREALDRHNNGTYGYTTSYEILKFDDAKISLIYEGLFDDKKALRKMEREYIESLPNCVNKAHPTRTSEEYREMNKEKI